jgi:hypothetical protein
MSKYNHSAERVVAMRKAICMENFRPTAEKCRGVDIRSVAIFKHYGEGASDAVSN